jgi:DNA-binding NtrC family response regulator
MRGRILVVDDEPEMTMLLRQGLTRRGFEVEDCTDAPKAFARLTDHDFDAAIADLNMPGLNGLDLCQRIAANHADLPVIVVTGFGSLDTAIAAIRAGAYDFVTKPFELDHIALTLDRAVRQRRLSDEVKRLRIRAGESTNNGEMLGESEPVTRLRSLLARVAPTDATILLIGETGSGKEVAAREIHRQSPRADAPLVAVNCASVPEPLLESELFGHVKGAFTDARTDRKGLFQQASSGTIFLDEVADMPAAIQPKLLRALQDHRARPVGADDEVDFDVRVIAASNRDLEQLVAQGKFREDLYFRLNVVRIDVPPLRTRGNDVLLLAQRFLERCAAKWSKGVKGLSPGAADRLLAYSWPGNVRELANSIERAVAVTQFEQLTVEDLPEKVRNYNPTRLPLVGDAPEDLVPLSEVEMRYIQRVLDSVGGNRTEAARILGLDRKTLYRKLQAEEEH